MNWNDPQLNIVSSSNGRSRSLLPVASCLDCFYFLSLHSFSFSLNGNTHGEIWRERQTDGEMKNETKQNTAPLALCTRCINLMGIGGISQISPKHCMASYVQYFIDYDVAAVLASEKTAILTDWKASFYQ